jgi:pyruvate formate lyase activating enzyme
MVLDDDCSSDAETDKAQLKCNENDINYSQSLSPDIIVTKTHVLHRMLSRATINFGGFIPLSTVDWRGKSVCVVFFRGCPVRCWYCHNETIQDGEDIRDIAEVIGEISSASLLVSAVVFSGGEATMQPEALYTLATWAKSKGLATGLHTNGVYSDVLQSLIEKKLIDHIALDIKAEWRLYTNRLGFHCVDEIKNSLLLCKTAHKMGTLPEFEVVFTLFRGYEGEIGKISSEIGEADLVLQQGIKHTIPPLSTAEIKAIADTIHRTVRIRTREDGEITYESSRDRWSAGIR